METQRRPTLALYVDYTQGGYNISLIRELDAAVNEYGADLFIISIGQIKADPANQKSSLTMLDALASRVIDGAIFITAGITSDGSHDRFSALLRPHDQVPLVSLTGSLAGRPSFLIQNRGSFDELIRHLLGHHGYRNPVFVTGLMTMPDARERLTSFQTVLKEFEIDCTPDRIHYGRFLMTDGVDAVQTFWDQRGLHPDVVICSDDSMAIGLWLELRRRGFHVPQDIAIVGFNDLPLSRHYPSQLTTIRQPMKELAHLAVQTILDEAKARAQGLAWKRDWTQHVPTEPVIRHSCGCVQEVSPGINELLFVAAAESSQATDHDMSIAWAVEGFCLAFAADQILSGHLKEETLLISRLRTKTFFLSLFAAEALTTKTESRLYLGWRDGKRLDLPPEGLKFPTLDFYPQRFRVPNHQSLRVHSLSKEGRIFGVIVMDWGTCSENACEIMNNRVSEAIVWARTTQMLEEKNRKLQQASEQLERLSLTDELTGHFNRRGFLALGSRQLSASRRRKEGVWVLFMDLDGLKRINDTYGHDDGDTAIKAFGEVIRRSFRETDVMGRLGGDEFTVIAPCVETSSLEVMRDRTHHLLEEANKRLNKPWKLDMSLGAVYSPPEDSSSVDELLQLADKALYEEKRSKRMG